MNTLSPSPVYSPVQQALTEEHPPFIHQSSKPWQNNTPRLLTSPASPDRRIPPVYSPVQQALAEEHARVGSVSRSQRLGHVRLCLLQRACATLHFDEPS